MRLRPTLGQLFVFTSVGLALLLGALLTISLHVSREAIVESAELEQGLRSKAIVESVEAYLAQADGAIRNIENQIRYGSCEVEDALSVEAHLFAEMLNNMNLAEVALTHAVREGDDERGQIVLRPEGRWQVSVYRETAGDDAPILTRFTYADRGRFAKDMRRRVPGMTLLEAPLLRVPKQSPEDPTEHPTFYTPASARWRDVDDTIWSDLSYTELDAHLPEAEQRVVVTVLKAVHDRGGRFIGVARVAILARQLDREVARVREEDPARAAIFLCDDRGRLITRLAPEDPLRDLDGDLRIVPARVPPEVARALEHPLLRSIEADHLEGSGRFELAGRRYLLAFKGLPETQGWRVGTVVAEDRVPGFQSLVAGRKKLMRWSAGLIGLILAGGMLTLRAVRRGLAQIVARATRMRDFDFTPSSAHAAFADLDAVLDSVELAKTAMRAMGKYVPVDLVRDLYRTRREPALGGELADVTILFTDIEDFTSYAERLSPDELAQALGAYLAAMTGAIHSTDGTIDKYIGDAVMALWNAPRPCPGHARRACGAALECLEATRRLYERPEWAARPRFATRFGLHRDRVMVGHFGAPDRMSYTALGDGVNLASRLEGLNKHYGTTILASQPVYEEARGAFEFRLLDVVAVKGKSRGVRVYELIGAAGAAGARLGPARRYEQAFERYLERRFDDALALLEAQPEDPPSAVLARRCRAMRAEPPPPDWDGIYVSRSK